MLIINSILNIKKKIKSSVITIGNFDGVHIGHKTLLLKTVKKAKDINACSIAITFNPHPKQILNTVNPLKNITSYEQKIKLINKIGIDILIIIPFTKKFASTSAEAFIKNILINQMGMKIIVIGIDYSFGKGRTGSIKTLREYASNLNFKVLIEPWVQSKKKINDRISSTIIRKIIAKGNVEDASIMLGRKYNIQGQVIHGKKIGKKIIGFATANVKPENNLYPQKGVYSVTISYKKRKFNGIANIGINPTFKNKTITLEVHIFNYTHNIYGKKISINFLKHIRKEIKFLKVTDLIKQINKDIKKVKKYFYTY